MIEPGTTDYTTNELNQYISIQYSVSSIQLSYDLDGNLIEDNIHHFTYDAENRLTSVTPITPTAGSTKVEYAYDYMSRRVEKPVYTYDGSSWVLETEKSFTYDGWNLIQGETTQGGTTSTEYYVWGLDLSGTLQGPSTSLRTGSGGIGGLLSKTNSLTSKTFLYIFDANGNVGQLVDSSTRTIAAHYEYDPFGKLLVSTGSEADSNVFRFSTKYYDVETELYYYWYRYYSSDISRWLVRDLIEEYGGPNLYGFVWNNPINRIDLFGLLSDESKALLRNLPSINAKSSITEIEAVVRTLIVIARKEGADIAADNLENYLKGGGNRTLPVDWLRSFERVKWAERANQRRFERDLKKLAKGMKEGETKVYSDYWDRLISYKGLGSDTEELFWASGDSTLSSYGGFILQRNSCEVEIDGTVIHVWHDNYNFHKKLGVFIPGYGRIPDAALLKLETHGSAKSFTMEAEWRQHLSGTVKLWLWGTFATAEWEWSGP